MRKWGCLALVLLLVLSLPMAGVAEVLYERMTLHSGFDSTPLEDDVTQRLLEAGFSAPTGGDQRSLVFFAVTDRAAMQQMQEGHPYASALDSAPLVVVIAGDEGKARYPELQEMDSGLAAMAMMVQAAEIGLSSCVLSISPQESRIDSARQALAMPDSFRPVLMVAFGYADADVTSSASVYNYDAARVYINGYDGE